jgi:NADH-quinone oxidoreductase subunit E
MILSEQIRTSILELQKMYPEKRSALIPALHLAQEEVGYLSLETQREVAALFQIDPNEVNAVVTFYEMFFEEPVGKHLLHVCQNVSCMLHGADALMNALCHKLQIQPGETTANGEWTLLAAECLAACDKAPMILVDEEVVGPVKENDLDALLEKATGAIPHG